MASIRTVTRQGFYRRVWSSPATHVAAELGITSTALAKIARKLNVPVPPPGHWARVRAGQTIVIPPLPPRVADQTTRHTIISRPPPRVQVAESARDVLEDLPVPAEEPVERDLSEHHDALLGDASARIARLEQAARLRTLADLLEPRILALPSTAPQRAWLRWARETIARAEADVLRGLGDGGER